MAKQRRRVTGESFSGKVYLDLHRMSEGQRIHMIGSYCVERPGKSTAFTVEIEETEGGKRYAKGDRYLEKLAKAFPGIVAERFDGPVPGVETIKVVMPKGEDN